MKTLLALRRPWIALLIAAVGVALFSAHPSIAPAGPDSIIVTSTANTDDGMCDETNCSLREAIDDANDGVSDFITFDETVFAPGDPGVILLEDGLGALPAITADIVIDASGAGVIIDGDTTDDGTGVGPGLQVQGAHTFDLLGEGAFLIRDIGGRGIDIVGGGQALDALSIDGIEIDGTTSHGIFVSDMPYASDVSITNSTIEAGNTGIGVMMTGPVETSAVYIVANQIEAANTEDAPGAAVVVNMQGALVTDAIATITIEDNPVLESEGDNAIRLAYCDSDDACAMDNAQINASINGNGDIISAGDGIQTRFEANPDEPGSVESSIDVQVDGNESITAESDALDMEALLCCDSDNTVTIDVTANGPISTLPEGDDGIDVEAGACCSPGSGVLFNASENTGGISVAEGDGIALNLVCCGTNSVDITGNEGAITSLDDNGINVSACIEDMAAPEDDEIECIENSTTVINTDGNTVIDNAEDGIQICCGVMERGGERSHISNNTVTGNAENGIEIDSSSGITVGPANVVTDNGTVDEGGTNGITIANLASVLAAAAFDAEILSNGNTVTQNETQRNVGLGIDLVGYSALAPDPQVPTEDDLDYSRVGCLPYPKAAAVAPNDCALYPTLISVVDEEVIGSACVGCTVEVFLANDIPDDQAAAPAGAAHIGGGPPQHGEGATYLASGTADVKGGFDIELPCGLPEGELTATLTNDDGNTSEFAANILFSGTSGVDCTPTTTPGAETPTQTPGASTPTTTSTPPGATATPTRTRTPTPTTAPGLCGDADGNGSVSSIDSAIILQLSAALIDSVANPDGADVDGNGMINAIDASLILQNVAGLLDELEC